MSKLFSHASCVLPVSNIDRSIEFYTNKLGFEVTFSWNTPIDYAIVKRENIEIHLTLKEGYEKDEFIHTNIYVFVNDIQLLHEEYTSKHVTFYRDLNDQEYGMTDFDIMDLDGHILTFGMIN
ncbi:glyoxalase superfamily protein [Aquimarina spongiae]|uniref:Glyoxalase-like domain-containing protein n=1 Tax=Aquimarina spongiae TaxID=570521 RepID=A0A1M6HF91_9FLAO|nr:glyoxalase superfamily protein [Aquimarina spongiae]SHJ20888.1 Glyoxalase-like domain-containing protein [Aquimarina spongiae]